MENEKRMGRDRGDPLIKGVASLFHGILETESFFPDRLQEDPHLSSKITVLEQEDSSSTSGHMNGAGRNSPDPKSPSRIADGELDKPLKNPVRRHKSSSIFHLIKDRSVLEPDDNLPALHLACRQGNVQKVEDLLQKGDTPVDSLSPQFFVTPLLLVLHEGPKEEVALVRALLHARAAVDKRAESAPFENALELASQTNSPAKKLLWAMHRALKTGNFTMLTGELGLR